MARILVCIFVLMLSAPAMADKCHVPNDAAMPSVVLTGAAVPDVQKAIDRLMSQNGMFPVRKTDYLMVYESPVKKRWIAAARQKYIVRFYLSEMDGAIRVIARSFLEDNSVNAFTYAREVNEYEHTFRKNNYCGLKRMVWAISALLPQPEPEPEPPDIIPLRTTKTPAS